MRLISTAVILFFSLTVFAQQKPDATLLFDFGNTVLTGQSQQDLPGLIRQLKDKSPAVITLKGYTDKKGSDELNDTLARSRVMAVVQILKQTMPPGTKFQISSYGSDNLLTKADEKQGINRRVEITVTERAQPPKKELTKLDPYNEDVEEQRFVINLDDTARITAKDGTFIQISPGSLQYKSGEPAAGMAEVRIKEYYQPSKIMLAGLNSSSPQGLLQSGGMLAVCILKGADTLSAKTKKDVMLKMPVTNGMLTNMNIYTLPHSTGRGAGQWNNTGRMFSYLQGGWIIPDAPKLEDVFFPSNTTLDNIKVGKSYSDKQFYARPLFLFKKRSPFLTKRASFTLLKTKADTILVTESLQFRNKGRREFKQRTFDTTYVIYNTRAQYLGYLDSMNYINCDRFMNMPNTVDFYVSTPGFEGMNMLTYFKTLSAYMPAYANADKFTVSRVPPGVPVVLMGVGKKGKDFYFGKKEFITGGGKTCEVTMVKVSEEEFRKGVKNM